MVRWLHLTFLAEVKAGGEAQYHLETDCQASAAPTGLAVDDGPDAVTITTGVGPGALRLAISKRRFNLFEKVQLDTAGDGFGDDDCIISPRDDANLRMAYEHRSARIDSQPPEVTRLTA